MICEVHYFRSSKCRGVLPLLAPSEAVEIFFFDAEVVAEFVEDGDFYFVGKLFFGGAHVL